MPSRNLDAFQRVGFCLFRVARSRRRLGEKNCDGTNRPAHQALYDNTAARAGVAYSGTYCATAAHQVARGNAAGHKSKTRASAAAEPMSNLVFITPHRDQNELANSLKHEGIRVGEIIASSRVGRDLVTTVCTVSSSETMCGLPTNRLPAM